MKYILICLLALALAFASCTTIKSGNQSWTLEDKLRIEKIEPSVYPNYSYRLTLNTRGWQTYYYTNNSMFKVGDTVRLTKY